MEALGGGLGELWNSNHPFRKRPKKPNSKSKSSNSAAATGRAGYQFPLKQAVMAGWLAVADNTIAQLREHWTKQKPLNSDSNALTKVSLSDNDTSQFGETSSNSYCKGTFSGGKTSGP
ncbi:hypothetical protein SO802_009630 [Lithocarpus litseifolius]|uniref:Uncharacterized protein n=1 Tax=Lithocarpus litseifolius TaxID=425828 RepID=A0AAW2DEI8_9ROSI